MDAATLRPIPDVAVFNSGNSIFAQSDENGVVSFTEFSKTDTLYFQHPAYQLTIIPYEQVLARSNIFLKEAIIQFDEVVIKGTKWEQSGEIPQSVVSITPSDIQFSNPQTSADLLTTTGQVFVQKSQLGGGSPMIRGFSANAVLLAVNGIRMNNAIFRGGNLQNVINIDPNMIERADVVLGPGSVIYGSDALGGVMNFRVKEPVQAKTSELLVLGTAFLRYSSANNERTGHLNVNLGGKKIGWLSSFTYSAFDDLITGEKRTSKFPDYGRRYAYVIPNGLADTLVANSNSNKQVFSGFSSWQTMQRLQMALTPTSFLSYDFFYSTTSDVPRYDRLLEREGNGLKNSEWNYGPQQWMMNALKLTSFDQNTFYEELRIILANQQFRESRIDRKFQDPFRRTRKEQVNVWTLNIDFEKEFGDTQQLAYGIEGVYNGVLSEANSINVASGEIGRASTRYPDGGSEMGSAGIYGSYQNQFKPHVLFTVGARYQHFYLQSRFSDTTFYQFPYSQIDLNKGALTGSIGLTTTTSNFWQFDFLLGSGFRAPNVDDVGKVFDSVPGNVVVPNENLGPEYIYNGEITVSKTIRDKFEISVTGFYSHLRDAMVRRDFTVDGQDSIIYDGELSKVEALTNTGSAYIAGLSGTLQYSFLENFSLYSSITFMDGEDLEENLPLRHVTPVFGKTGLTFRGIRLRTEVNLRYQGPVAWNDLAPSEQSKTELYTTDGALGWTTLNWNLSYSPTTNLQINTGVENILNIHYRPYSSGISAPGINVILSIRYTIN
jgi:hemoglobin/transferrin/lactoferrin receptor protein